MPLKSAVKGAQTPVVRDEAIFSLIQQERMRQEGCLELIASENLVSSAVMEAQGSVLTNKYAEGYPGARYYSGCEFVDGVERLAQERAQKLFNCSYANVQPHSGSQANQAVFLALLKPGDTFLGMALDSGGHLTHGARVSVSGKWFKAFHYGVNPETHQIDFDALRAIALKERPKLVIAGASAYARQIDFQRVRKIADEVGAYVLADIAHVAGLVATGKHASPFPHAHVVTSTTHKTLRGPRGGMILAQDTALGKKLNAALFPGIQGGPLMHVIAGKAVAFHEALQPTYSVYIDAVIKNADALARTLLDRGVNLVGHGTDNHLVLIDLRGTRTTGAELESALEAAGMSANKNKVPNDPQGPRETSGLRLGSAACTTRGLGVKEFTAVGEWIAEILRALESGDPESCIAKIRQKVAVLCKQYPINL